MYVRIEVSCGCQVSVFIYLSVGMPEMRENWKLLWFYRNFEFSRFICREARPYMLHSCFAQSTDDGHSYVEYGTPVLNT